MSIVRRKILLTGKNGQVGWELERSLQPLGQVFAFDHAGMDLADPDSVRAVIREVKPDLIVNPAAYTAVDKAESEPDLAMAVNGIAPGIIAEEAKRLGAVLVHYSTDYVFDGTKGEPYTEDDVPNPINVYGKTKLAGEQAIQAAGAPHLIFRTSWVYGSRGKNFLRTIMRLAKEQDELRIVDDQIGAPTWCRTIAEATGHVLSQFYSPLIRAQPSFTAINGIYNLTAGGSTSWCGFGRAIVENELSRTNNAADKPSRLARVMPITTAEYSSPARRPRNSLLLSDLITNVFGVVLQRWDIALNLALAERYDE